MQCSKVRTTGFQKFHISSVSAGSWHKQIRAGYNFFNAVKSHAMRARNVNSIVLECLLKYKRWEKGREAQKEKQRKRDEAIKDEFWQRNLLQMQSCKEQMNSTISPSMMAKWWSPVILLFGFLIWENEKGKGYQMISPFLHLSHFLWDNVM